MPGLGEIVTAWPFAASLAAAAGASGVREARRRAALNQALHELRRPLQVLTLTAGASAGDAGRGTDDDGVRLEDTVRMAATALERLQREVNGEAVTALRETVGAKTLLEASVARWTPSAAAAGSSLRLLWRAGGEPALTGDPQRLAQALDNLLANAIEHGGRRIEVEARARDGVFRALVRDSGPPVRPAGRQVGTVRRLSGRNRHGHGLRVVRRVAAEHGGRFELRRNGSQTEAVLELPLEQGAEP
ncbi:MAG TPA: HAMP domain-containing sensor histidine kinase [Solirubrobacterales bacterium]